MEWENTHDKATSLLNRESFPKNTTSIYNKLEQVGIVFADIDNLKKANDELGHEMGDRLAKKRLTCFYLFRKNVSTPTVWVATSLFWCVASSMLMS